MTIQADENGKLQSLAKHAPVKKCFLARVQIIHHALCPDTRRLGCAAQQSADGKDFARHRSKVACTLSAYMRARTHAHTRTHINIPTPTSNFYTDNPHITIHWSHNMRYHTTHRKRNVDVGHRRCFEDGRTRHASHCSQPLLQSSHNSFVVVAAHRPPGKRGR